MSRPQSYSEFLQQIQPVRHSASLVRFALVFLVAFFLLQWGYQALSDTAAYRFYIETLTVPPSVVLIHLFTPTDSVMAQAHRLVWPGGRLSIINGCDGAEAMELLIAAFIAVAGTWRMRASGIGLGVVLIYGLNQLRIVALYFAVRHDRPLFELIHGVVGPLAIIAVACLFFVWWTGRSASTDPA
jgi:exosortase family protein XrtM